MYQIIRAHSVIWGFVLSQHIVFLVPTASTAATVDHLSVHVGIGTLQTAHFVAVRLGATRVLHHTSAVKNWG